MASVVPVESLRWITFGHVESDECGAMNMWLAAAPDSQVAHGALGCMVSLNDLCDRPPRPLEDGEVIDLGGKRLRQISTPHVPHGWEAQVLFEETTGHAAVRRSLHRHRRADPPSPPATWSARPWRPRPCSTPPAWRRTPRPRCAASATCSRRRWPSCTARRSRATASKALYDLAAEYETLVRA